MRHVRARFDRRRGDQLAAGDPAGGLDRRRVAGEGRDDDCHRLDHGPGHRRVAELLEQQDRVDDAEAHPAGVLRSEDADDAHVGELLPQRRAVGPAVLPQRAQVGGGELLREQVAETVGEQELVVGESEAHRQTPFGSCRTRSAMMLRWISFVPA